MSGKDVGLVIGGEPRIDFLPPEVKAAKQARRTRRSLGALVLLVVAACAAGVVFATTLNLQAQEQLVSAQDRTRALIQEQGEYAEVRTVTGQIASATNARLVGSANEVLWTAYLGKVVSVLPGGTTIDTYSVESQSANEAAPVAEVPLRQPRIATVNFIAGFPNLAQAKSVLKNLETLPGYAGAWVTPIELTDEGTYSANFTLYVNSDVTERRFFKVEAESAEPEATEDEAVVNEAATDGEG